MEVGPQIVFDQHETEIYNRELVPINHYIHMYMYMYIFIFIYIWGSMDGVPQ